MTIEKTIEAALFMRTSSLPLSPALPISWPNVPFTVPASRKYLNVSHLPNRSRRRFLKGSNPHQRMGVLQITVVWPLATGSAATDIAGQVAEHFPADLSLHNDGVRVRITKAPDIPPPIKSDVSWSVPVSISYEAFA